MIDSMELLRRSLVSGLAALAAMTSLDRSTHAEEVGASPQIEIVLAGASPHNDQAEQLLGDVLRSQGVPVTFVVVPTLDPDAAFSNRHVDISSLARVWIDLRRQDQIVLFLVDHNWEHALVRQVALTEGVDLVALEEVGQIVSAAIEALIAGRPLEMTPDEAAEMLQTVEPFEEGRLPDAESSSPPGASAEDTSLPPPSASTPAEGPVDLELCALYAVAPWSSGEAPLHGPSFWFLVGFERVRLRPALALSIDYRVPSTIIRDDVEASIQRLQLRVDARIQLFSMGIVSMRLGIGGGVDLSFVDPELVTNRGGLEASPSAVVAGPIVQGALSLNVHLTSTWFITFEVALSIEVKDLIYVFRIREESEVFFDPWRVLPFFSVGVAADLL